MTEVGLGAGLTMDRSVINTALVGETVTTKFKTQLADLMETITATRVQYIRCIKPNPIKSKTVMDHMQVHRWLVVCNLPPSLTSELRRCSSLLSYGIHHRWSSNYVVRV